MDSTTSIYRESELRTHIRGLLLQYSLTHLATNYVTWTQESVADLLSECLNYVPLAGPTCVALPVEPLETLSQRWGLSKLDLYEERWKVENSEVLPYLKKQLPSGRSACIAEGRWRDDYDDEYDSFQIYQRPMSPILTLRARKETPRPGKSARPQPRTCGQSLRSLELELVEVSPLSDPPVRTDDALGNKLAIDPATHREVVTLIQSIPAMSAHPQACVFKPYEEFLRSTSPTIDEPEPAMLPLFPRGQRMHHKPRERQQEVQSFTTALEAITPQPVSWLVPVHVKEEEEEDMANEHLVLVDGWQAFKTPSSPLTPGTPSLANTSSDIDELFLPSSSMPYTEEFQPLEEYQIPRCEKIGSSRSQPTLPGQHADLSAFLSPLIRQSQVDGPRIVHSPKSQPSSPRTTITMSMLGQPPSIDDPPGATGSLSRAGRPAEDTLSSDDSITFAVKAVERACGDRLGDEDPISLILEETLDDKDGMLMNVPILRPPNEHTEKHRLPACLPDIIAPAKSTNAKAQTDIPYMEPYMRCIKKVKGLGPLQIELSWIPFKYGCTVPTDEEVADVANDPCPQLSKAIDLPQDEIVSSLALLLDESMAFNSQPMSTNSTYSEYAWSGDDPLVPSLSDCSLTDSVLVLPRGDRRRLAGLPALEEDEDEEDTGSSDKENEYNHEAERSSDRDRPLKKVRFQDPIDEPLAEPTVYMFCDDSGIFMVGEETAKPGSDDSASFGQLAYDAEGFDGPTADGNLFPDMHPVYFDEYNFDMSPRQYALDPYASAWTAPSQSPLDLADHCAAQATAIEDVAADDGFLPEEQLIELAGALHGPCVVTSQGHHETLARLSHHEDTATDAVMRTGTEGPRTSAAAAPALLAISARQSLEQFLTFCGKGFLVQSSTAAPASSQPEGHAGPPSCGPDVRGLGTAPRDTPAELLDDRTLLLPGDYEPSATAHRYMASMSVIQKRALVRALGAYCAVDLVEREHLGEGADDVHIIMDCETAVLFFSLEMLPSGGDALAALLTRLSWRYMRLLVIFECYPSSWGYRGDRDFSDKPIASAWSPPVVKAVKKLRRDLSISEGVQTKSTAALVEYAFANTVEEAAVFARLYGDDAETRTPCSVTWGERLWLTHEERDGEYDLSGVPGMNLFAASLLLSQTTLEEFLEKTPSERLVEYGTLVGAERIERFNVEMAHRLEIMQLPPSSPIDASMSASSSSLNSVPYFGDSDLGVGAFRTDHS